MHLCIHTCTYMFIYIPMSEIILYNGEAIFSYMKIATQIVNWVPIFNN